MDNKLVDTGTGMQSEKIDMDKYNLEHMVEKEVAEQEVERNVRRRLNKGLSPLTSIRRRGDVDGLNWIRLFVSGMHARH
jgi:hypothetical protein